MDEVSAIGLQIDAFARRVGADENAQRLLGRIGIEGRLHLLAAVLTGRAGEYVDAVVGPIGFGQRLAQPPFQPAPRVLVFGEDDQPAIVPGRSRTEDWP